MMKMKLNKKIAGATAMLMISAAMLGTSTFAWFTMNREVTITGMEVKTHVGSNLLIQKTTLAGTALESEDGFITDETQTIKAVLEPVSTIDGKSFFYTLDAKADGSKLHSPIGTESGTVAFTSYEDGLGAATGSGASSYANKFSQDYGADTTFVSGFTGSGSAAVGYVDYVFQLKATNNEGTAQAINLTKLDLTYAGSPDSEQAYRVAVFVSSEANEGGTVPDWTSKTNLPTANAIYTPTNANPGNLNFSAGEAVNSTTTRGTVTYTSSATALASVPANSVKYYKVIVRMWIEGEDKTCNTSTFKGLTDKWSLDLQMELGQGTGVDKITMKTTGSGTP